MAHRGCVQWLTGNYRVNRGCAQGINGVAQRMTEKTQRVTGKDRGVSYEQGFSSQ